MNIASIIPRGCFTAFVVGKTQPTKQNNLSSKKTFSQNLHTTFEWFITLGIFSLSCSAGCGIEPFALSKTQITRSFVTLNCKLANCKLFTF